MCTKLEYEKKHQKWTQTNNLLKKNDKMDKLINNSWKSQKKSIKNANTTAAWIIQIGISQLFNGHNI